MSNPSLNWTRLVDGTYVADMPESATEFRAVIARDLGGPQVWRVTCSTSGGYFLASREVATLALAKSWAGVVFRTVEVSAVEA